ncbi:hypothetical protein AVEN_196673-1 [Araneus ventricosus]|uniref:Uncharacterized protein n=1 Tax=Araneus ventricosus TaxID=182803 RepID=A0A4Y2KU46_ARAVE|nr:hypothetical protein AVEN_196673-1 [Araneus ventricosus]
MPFANPFLKAVSSLDPCNRKTSVALELMKELPLYASNVVQDSEKEAYDLEIRIYLNAGPTCLTRLGRNHVLSIEPVLRQPFSHHSVENLVPDKCSLNFVKWKYSLCHREVIQRKCPGMLSDEVILLHDYTHIARKTQELLRKFKWEGPLHP